MAISEISPRPLILFAPQGNTATESKNLDHETQAEVLRGLLDLTDGTVIQLDWDQRVFKLPNWRVRHLGDDWRPLGTIELYALIQRADLVIGCDSGNTAFHPVYGYARPRRLDPALSVSSSLCRGSRYVARRTRGPESI